MGFCWLRMSNIIFHILPNSRTIQEKSRADDTIYSLLLMEFRSVQFIHSVVSDSLRPHEPQHARLPCPSPTPGIHPNPCPLSWWCHPTISSSVVPFSSCSQSFPPSGSFLMSQLFTSGGQSIGVSASASVLPVNIQDWFPLGLTGILKQCKCIVW